MSNQKGMLSAVSPPEVKFMDRPEKRLKKTSILIMFDEEDLNGTSQPHDDALVVTSRIGGFLVKRVLVDHGSGAEIMYPKLYKGLGLKPEDLSRYDTPLVRFDGKVVILEG